MPDLETLDDARTLVHRFYDRVRHDALLAPVFAARVRDWDSHLERMTLFWGAVLFARPLYHGRPTERHAGLPIGPAHYERWLTLWRDTVDEAFTGPRADHAKRGADKMAVKLLLSAAA
jgi:hemoglobin